MYLNFNRDILSLYEKKINICIHIYSMVHELLDMLSISIHSASLAANQCIRMISEESCDTEDWRNGC